jgi:predicted RNase H-like nuclease (RuvC/YqgF family)
MSEEENIHDNPDLSNSEEDVTSIKSETGPVAAPELEPEPEVEIISSVTEKSGVEEAATEEAMSEQIDTPDVKEPQLISQKKPKKQTTNTVMKIERSFADASKQIEKQTTQINKINQNLQYLQNQMRVGERQTEIVNQIRSQVNQIQKQVSQVQKSIQKRSSNISQKSIKKGIMKSKSKSNK